MSPPLEPLRKLAIQRAASTLTRLGHSPRTLGDVKRDVRWWFAARREAVSTRTPVLFKGWGLAFSESGYVELVESEAPRAGRDRITVLQHVSSVSLGTERAQYLRLPNAPVGGGTKPGYSGSGVVVAVGAGVAGFSVGDEVAIVNAPHASVITVKPSQAFLKPGSVSFEAASLIKLGVICGQGVRLSRLEPGQRFGVVGGGPIGALALRIAAAEGAEPAAVIATSRAKEDVARAGGAKRFLTSSEDANEIAALNLPVVIEATGDPAGIAVAVSAAGFGGRVVLLGSPRGVTRAFPIGEIRARGLELIGAHVDTLKIAANGVDDPERAEADRFLRLLVEGRLTVDDMTGGALDPRESARFYRSLARGNGVAAAHFDWRKLEAKERKALGNPLRVPVRGGRGIDLDKPALSPRRQSRASSPFQLTDPFEGAQGRLRIGMLGCGDISINNAAAVGGAPNAELTACFDPVRELADDLARPHGAAVAPTAEALITNPAVDAVFISVPHHLHAPLALQAIEAGRHVIVEKPPANNLAAAREMQEAAERAGVTLSICFPQRYEPGVMVARQLIQHGALGEFSGSTIKVYLDKSPAYWLGGFSGRTQSSWRQSREQAGGGVLIMNVCHYIDIVRHLAGVEATTVTAIAGTVDDGVEVEDSIAVALGYRNGAVGTIVGSSSTPGATVTEVGLWGSDGHIQLEPEGRVYSLRAINGLRTTRWQAFSGLPSWNARAVYVSRFATAVASGISPDISAEDGLAVQGLIEAAYRSSDERSMVQLGALDEVAA